ncbi:MAG: hypothetical protein ICCCNLDF_02299 [Planctomycetes bacterium]|nr:hypothetical protein [Planctomycetota bacterium]
MKRLLIVLTCALCLAACGDDSAAGNGKRIVEQDKLHAPGIPLDAVDESVQTEAVAGSMRTIAQQLKLKLAVDYNGDLARLSKDFSGPMNATKLTKLGLTEQTLTGSFYKPTDFNLSFSGKTVTITALSPGTRGYTKQDYSIS